MPLPARPLYDPFIGTVTQTHRLRAVCQIYVNGYDVSPKLDPHLINMHVIDGPHAALHVELDDRDGRLPLPPLDSNIIVSIGWYNEPLWKVFGGVIFDIEHGFGRDQGGRRLWIHATGTNWKIGKNSEMNSWGEGDPVSGQGQQVPLKQVLQDAFESQGLNIAVHSKFANIMRNFWMQNMESALHMGQRMANEHGALFRVTDGNQGVFTDYGQNADGSNTAVINAKWGDNLIGWRVHPIIARSTWSGSAQTWYDSITSKFGDIASSFSQNGISGGAGSSQFSHSGSAANKNNAGQDNSGVQNKVQNEFGDGRIVINGEPRAAWNCGVQLIGARPGVDGLYRATQVEHIYSREGFITWVDVFPVYVEGGTNVYAGGLIQAADGRTYTIEDYNIWAAGTQTGAGGVGPGNPTNSTTNSDGGAAST